MKKNIAKNEFSGECSSKPFFSSIKTNVLSSKGSNGSKPFFSKSGHSLLAKAGTTSTIRSDGNPETETIVQSKTNTACTNCEKENSLVETNTVKTETQAALGPVAPAAGNRCAIQSANFTSIPSGKITASFSGSTLGAPFDMKGSFVTNTPCNCSYGEYRQYVRGYFKSDGTKVTHNLCSNTLDESTYHEDCATSGGTNLKYGYRSIPFGTSNFNNPDQAGGCDFVGWDHPGISGATGKSLEVKLEFLGALIDTSSSNKVLKASSWSVEGSGTAP